MLSKNFLLTIPKVLQNMPSRRGGFRDQPPIVKPDKTSPTSLLQPPGLLRNVKQLSKSPKPWSQGDFSTQMTRHALTSIFTKRSTAKGRTPHTPTPSKSHNPGPSSLATLTWSRSLAPALSILSLSRIAAGHVFRAKAPVSAKSVRRR